MLSNFPLCIKGWLEMLEVQNIDGSYSDWKLSGTIPVSKWHSKFCLLMENDSKFYIFNDESAATVIQIPAHITQCHLDTELGNLYKGGRYCFTLNGEASTTSSMNQDIDRHPSNSLTSLSNQIKANPNSGFPRDCSRFFRPSKSNNKTSAALQPNQDNHFENNQSTKSVSGLKRTLSLSRIHRKKSEEKSESKNAQSQIKSNLISHSTGDLAVDATSSPAVRFDLTKDSNISEVHSSLIGERPHCFSVCGLAEEMKSNNYQTRYFAARSNLEKQCWMRRLHQTLKPNMENDNRINNSLRLTIFESKCLPAQKRNRYYCEVSLDKTLYAKTTSKWSDSNGCVFWAEDINLNNLPIFKTLTTALYKEPDPGKDSKKKKRKHQNQCIGQIVLNLSYLNNNSEIQSWFNLRSPDILPDLSSGSSAQLRVKLRYQSLKVLKNNAYTPLYEIATRHYVELIQFFERNLSIKLKEEISVCLVSIHEKNGSIIQFLCDLISEEVNDLDNGSMALRANTIVTKIIETHMKLVGCQYLDAILHPLIHEVMFKNVTVEVDPSRYDTREDNKENLLIDNQHILTEYLKEIWNKIYESKKLNFPKQLKSVFVGWRKKLTSHFPTTLDEEKIAIHCDVIVSGCLFLRLLCPAILSPHLFGLVSHFSDQAAVQRTLTLIAKSLQSLANFSKFGEKEHFMIFLNACFDEEIPRMRDFLRYISTTNSDDEDDDETDSVDKEIHFYGASIDLPVVMAHLHNCLVSDEAKRHLYSSPKIQNIVKLPEILHQISEKLMVFSVTQSNPSFFSLKKSQLPNSTPYEQRRTSMVQLLIEPLKNIRIPSPPRLRSPVSQSKFVEPESLYAQHNDDSWNLRSGAKEISFKSIKETRNPPVNYYAKPHCNISRNAPQQLSANWSGHRKDHEIEFDMLKHSDTKLPSIFYRSNYDDNQLATSLPSSGYSNQIIPHSSTSKEHWKTSVIKIVSESPSSQIDDVGSHKRSRYCRGEIDACDKDFYIENPTYDLVDIDKNRESILYPVNRRSGVIDRYFTVRNEVRILNETNEQGTCDSNDYRNEHLQRLSRELKEIRNKIHRDQLKDLKQLEEMIHFSKKSVSIDKCSLESISKAPGTRARKTLENNQSTTDILDDVINSITIGEEGLVEAQENLRKQIMKGKTPNKRPTTSAIPFQHPLQSLLVPHNSEPNSPRVTVGGADHLPSRVTCPASSNGSPLIKGMI